MAKATCYLQVKPTYGYQKKSVSALAVSKMTARAPGKPLAGTKTIKLMLELPDELFLPDNLAVEVIFSGVPPRTRPSALAEVS